jgi:hypothetical protein
LSGMNISNIMIFYKKSWIASCSIYYGPGFGVEILDCIMCTWTRSKIKTNCCKLIALVKPTELVKYCNFYKFHTH